MTIGSYADHLHKSHKMFLILQALYTYSECLDQCSRYDLVVVGGVNSSEHIGLNKH